MSGKPGRSGLKSFVATPEQRNNLSGRKSFVATPEQRNNLLCASTFFIEGGFANFAPYTVERYGVRLGARASGLGQAANGVGKIVGPLSLALIAGSSNVVSPQATSDAVLPAYLFLAFCMLLVGLSFVFLGVEAHGQAMGVGDDERMIEPRGGGSRCRAALTCRGRRLRVGQKTSFMITKAARRCAGSAREIALGCPAPA
jgi:hypothetical protein